MPTYPFSMRRWTITDPVTKRRRETSYLMTEADALAKDQTAEKVGKEVVINGPAPNTSDFLRVSSVPKDLPPGTIVVVSDDGDSFEGVLPKPKVGS